MIIDSTPGLLQKNIAKKLNDTMAYESHAITDFNDFLRGRKNYSLDKQERLANILGYSYLEMLKYGENLLDNKIIDFNEEKNLRKFITKNGENYSIATILKMAEDFLCCEIADLQLDKSYLVDNILTDWQKLLSKKREAINN